MLMTRHRGEYIFRIGSHPPHTVLFTGDLSDSEGWSGISRTEQEVESLLQMITVIAEEAGGKVHSLSKAFMSRVRRLTYKYP